VGGGRRELNKFTRCESVYIGHTERQHLKRIYIVPEFPLFFFCPLYLSFSPFLPAYINKYSLHRCRILAVSLFFSHPFSLQLHASASLYPGASYVYEQCSVGGAPKRVPGVFIFIIWPPTLLLSLLFIYLLLSLALVTHPLTSSCSPYYPTIDPTATRIHPDQYWHGCHACVYETGGGPSTLHRQHHSRVRYESTPPGARYILVAANYVHHALYCLQQG